MDLSVAFLGTGGAVPSARRSTASVLVARGGERLMFDCGEGTQRQMQRSLGLVQVDEIYLTHFHADHILGLPGLLKTYDLTEREGAADRSTARAACATSSRRCAGSSAGSDFKLDLVELEPGDSVPLDGRRGARLPGRAQRARAAATRWSRRSGPGRFDPEAAERLGRARKAPPSPLCSAARRSQGTMGPVRPEDVMGESRPGRTVVDHRRHGPLPGDGRGRPRRRAARPRRELLRGGGPARRRHRPLDRRPGRRGRPRGRSQDAGPRPHLLPLPRRQGARGGPRGLRARRRPARLRRGRDPLPRARRAELVPTAPANAASRRAARPQRPQRVCPKAQGARLRRPGAPSEFQCVTRRCYAEAVL